MNYLKRLVKTEVNVEEQLQAKGIEVASCDLVCSNCHQDYPKSLDVETHTVLWQSSKEYGLHILVPTGKTDWERDPTSTRKTVAHSAGSWAEKNGDKYPELSSNVKVSVTSLGNEKLVLEDDYSSGRVGDLLVLPFFVWIKGVKHEEVSEVLDLVVPALIKSRAEGATELSSVTSALTKFKDLVFEIDENHSYVFLCSHRSRDKRCGITAPILKKALDTQLRESGHYRDAGDTTPGGTCVTFLNHVGGHKFSANVLIYLRTGQIVWLARIKPGHADVIVEECILGGGKVWPDHLRVAKKFEGIEW